MTAPPVAAPPLPQAAATRVAEMLAGMADPTRVRILTALKTVCVPVTSVVDATGPRQPAVSHHLRILRDRGLVVAERRGNHVYYCLADQRVTDLLDTASVLAGIGQKGGDRHVLRMFSPACPLDRAHGR